MVDVHCTYICHITYTKDIRLAKLCEEPFTEKIEIERERERVGFLFHILKFISEY